MLFLIEFISVLFSSKINGYKTNVNSKLISLILHAEHQEAIDSEIFLCCVRQHRCDIEKYLKYRYYYVVTQQLLRAHAITFTWPRNSFTCELSSFYVRTQTRLRGHAIALRAHTVAFTCARKHVYVAMQQLYVRTQQLLRAHAITFTWPRNSFTCVRNNCPMKMLAIAAIITSICLDN